MQVLEAGNPGFVGGVCAEACPPLFNAFRSCKRRTSRARKRGARSTGNMTAPSGAYDVIVVGGGISGNLPSLVGALRLGDRCRERVTVALQTCLSEVVTSWAAPPLFYTLHMQNESFVLQPVPLPVSSVSPVYYIRKTWAGVALTVTACLYERRQDWGCVHCDCCSLCVDGS